MMNNPLELYIACTRIVFSVEPSEPSENWDEYEDFEDKIKNFYRTLLCKNCNSLLIDPCQPKKQHISCQHRVCLDCIGKNRMTALNCKMCRDFTLFEKSHQTKLVLGLFQELCELIRGSWIYDYIQRRKKPDTGQHEKLSLMEIIDNGINYGQVPIIVEDSSSPASSPSSVASSGDENSNCSIIKESPATTEVVPYSSHSPALTTTFPSISPLAPISPQIVVQSPSPLQHQQQPPQPIKVLPMEPMQTTTSTATAIPIVTPTALASSSTQLITQYPAAVTVPIIQSAVTLPPIIPTTSKITPNQSPSFITQQPQHHPVRMKTMPVHSTIAAKSIMSPIKIHQQQQQQHQTTPTIYSVMYTGSGNKITLKRKTPSDEQTTITSVVPHETLTSSSNMNLLKTESTIASNFKSPMIQMTSNSLSTPQTAIQSTPMITTQQIPIVTASPTLQQQQLAANQLHSLNPNEKRRGCRCGNATAAPGKLTCCGQRCPCYVDSKACIDCKCRGCRNPHYADGQKKMRHQVLDLQTQQQAQQNFLASIQHQTLLKEVQKSSSTVSLMKSTTTDEISLVEQSTTSTTTTTMIGKNSINNCIISMNNGQYQIKPRVIVKEPVRTTAAMSPIIFPTTSSTNNNNPSIQIVGLYSQVPMTTASTVGDKKIVIKSETQPGTVMTSFSSSDVKSHLLEPSATGNNYTANNLNSNLL